jgi:hypothetical protein
MAYWRTVFVRPPALTRSSVPGSMRTRPAGSSGSERSGEASRARGSSPESNEASIDAYQNGPLTAWSPRSALFSHTARPSRTSKVSRTGTL